MNKKCLIYKEHYIDRVPNKKFVMFGLYLKIQIESLYVRLDSDNRHSNDDVSECVRYKVACVRSCKYCGLTVLYNYKIINWESLKAKARNFLKDTV